MKEFSLGRLVLILGLSYTPAFYVDRRQSILDRLKKRRALLNVQVWRVWANVGWRLA